MTDTAGTKARATAIRVAVVDDHTLMLEGLTALLDRSPELTVPIAASNWDALLAHREFPVDVVVLDLFLDDSIPVHSKVRALTTAGCAVVVMSRHSDPSTVNAAMRAGALGFVPKTDSAELLIQAIRAAADGERFLPGRAADALEAYRPVEHPKLGAQEQRALILFARGLTVKEVAAEMSTTEETVKSYIKRARRKYRLVGVDLSDRVLLRNHARREGWLSPFE